MGIREFRLSVLVVIHGNLSSLLQNPASQALSLLENLEKTKKTKKTKPIGKRVPRTWEKPKKTKASGGNGGWAQGPWVPFPAETLDFF